MSQDNLKKRVGEAAVKFVRLGEVLGVGTGTTVNFFIDALHDIRNDIPAAVSSSSGSTAKLKTAGIEVVELNDVGGVGIYIDGADEVNHQLQMLKGGGGALTREKVIAAASEQFICIADTSKWVSMLGTFPLPVEVIPMARSHVARELVKLGGSPVLREGFITDNHNIILDVHNLVINEPAAIEARINQIAGVVTNGLFASRPADILLLGDEAGEIKQMSL